MKNSFYFPFRETWLLLCQMASQQCNCTMATHNLRSLFYSYKPSLAILKVLFNDSVSEDFRPNGRKVHDLTEAIKNHVPCNMSKIDNFVTRTKNSAKLRRNGVFFFQISWTEKYVINSTELSTPFLILFHLPIEKYKYYELIVAYILPVYILSDK